MKYILALILIVVFSGCVKNPNPSPSNKSISVDLQCKSETNNDEKTVRVYNFYPYRGLGIGVNVWSLTSAVIYNKNTKLVDGVLLASKRDIHALEYTSFLTIASAINSEDATDTIFLNSMDNTATINNIKYNCEDMSKAIELAKQELTLHKNKSEPQTTSYWWGN